MVNFETYKFKSMMIFDIFESVKNMKGGGSSGKEGDASDVIRGGGRKQSSLPGLQVSFSAEAIMTSGEGAGPGFYGTIKRSGRKCGGGYP